MHNHYYHIKKQCRKKSQPLYAYKIDANQEWDQDSVESLRKQFNIGSTDELREIGYILINEDGIRLP